VSWKSESSTETHRSLSARYLEIAEFQKSFGETNCMLPDLDNLLTGVASCDLQIRDNAEIEPSTFARFLVPSMTCYSCLIL
jgi:hypothetical protein